MSLTMTNKQRRKTKKMLNRTCPEHGVSLVHSSTQYGARYDCPEPGCTVCCWGNSTSTPADQETRTLRNQCHKAFDPLWISGSVFARPASGGRSARRRNAYAWLADCVGVPINLAHFGMFDAAQCRKALAEIEALLHDHREDARV